MPNAFQFLADHYVSFLIAHSKLLQFLIFFEPFCHLNRSRLIQRDLRGYQADEFTPQN